MTETPLDRTAIDTVLIKLNLGCQFLEIHHPTTQDLKTAAEAFKNASDILKASLVLLDFDCRVVMDPAEPAAAPSTPLFDGKGQPNPEADVTVVAEPAVKIAGTLGIIDVELITERKFKVGDRVKYLWLEEPEIGTVVEDDGAPEEERPYAVQAENDPESGLLYLSASDMEVVDADFVLPDRPVEPEPFPTGNKTVQKKAFDERLNTLEDIFCERLDLAGNTEPYGKQLKLFRPHRDAWTASWKDDAKATWPKLLAAIVEANKVGTEFTSWAPAA